MANATPSRLLRSLRPPLPVATGDAPILIAAIGQRGAGHDHSRSSPGTRPFGVSSVAGVGRFERLHRFRECGRVCREIFDTVPAWFGIPEANDAYVAFVETHETWVASTAEGTAVGPISGHTHRLLTCAVDGIRPAQQSFSPCPRLPS
jgi:hypothetical protein